MHRIKFFFYGPSRELVAGQVIIAVSVIANLASRFITCLADSTIQVENSENDTMILWREVSSKTIILCTFSEGEFFSIKARGMSFKLDGPTSPSEQQRQV